MMAIDVDFDAVRTLATRPKWSVVIILDVAYSALWLKSNQALENTISKASLELLSR